MIRFCLTLLLVLTSFGIPRGAIAQDRPAKELFGAQTSGSRQDAASHGGYARGCLAGAVELPESGPTWQAMRLSRNRNWGHPSVVDFLQDLSMVAAQQPGWEGLYIGDISQPRGGPMLTGHASHQIGLDADIWMLPPNRLNLSRKAREELSSISIRSKDLRDVNGNWTRQHHEILKAAASDPRVARIFVTAPAKLQMCKDETGDRRWLRKIRPWWGHHYHFHVRLSCPKGSRGCKNQAPPPKGDGCKDAVWWVTDALKPADPNKPKAKKKPKPPITLSGLPNQCARVLR